MATNYSGSGTATQAPSPTPGGGNVPIVSLPADADGGTWANAYQAYKALADYHAAVAQLTTYTLPTTSTDAPQLRIKDAAGNIRFLVDHNGFPMGRRSEFREEWIYNIGTVAATATPIVPAQRWSTTFTGTAGTLTISAPTSAYPANFVAIATAAAASAIYLYTAAPIIHTGNTFLTTVIEWEAVPNTDVTSGTHSETIWMGLADNATLGSSNNYCWFKATAGVGNWKCETGNGGVSTSTDSGVAANTTGTAPAQRWRIELHGSGSPYGSKARFFINEALVAQNTTNLPASAALYLALGCSSAASGNVVRLYSGPMLATWPRQLSLAAL